MCRVEQTAQLVFGEREMILEERLNEGCHNLEDKKKNCGMWMQAQITSPVKGGNLFLVTHSTNMRFLKIPVADNDYGAAGIFHPASTGSTDNYLGCLQPEDWEKLLEAKCEKSFSAPKGSKFE
jgi:hypothetical protein